MGLIVGPKLSRKESRRISNWLLEFLEFGENGQYEVKDSGVFMLRMINKHTGDVRVKTVSLQQLFQYVMKPEIHRMNAVVDRGYGTMAKHGVQFEKPRRLAIFK